MDNDHLNIQRDALFQVEFLLFSYTITFQSVLDWIALKNNL